MFLTLWPRSPHTQWGEMLSERVCTFKSTRMQGHEGQNASLIDIKLIHSHFRVELNIF